MVNSACIPFSESEMFEYASKNRGLGIQEYVATSIGGLGVGGGSGGLVTAIKMSSRRIDSECTRLRWSATESLAKVTGLKRKVGDLNTEAASAKDTADCAREDLFELESQVEVINPSRLK